MDEQKLPNTVVILDAHGVVLSVTIIKNGIPEEEFIQTMGFLYQNAITTESPIWMH